MMLFVSVLLVLTLADGALAQTQSEVIMIDQQVLAPAEASKYRSVVESIEQHLGEDITAAHAKESIDELLREVDRSDLSEEVQFALRFKIGEEAFDSVADAPQLVRRLLDSNENEMRFMAFTYVLNSGDCGRNQSWLQRRLVTLARDGENTQDVRIAALWVLKYRAPGPVSLRVASDLVARHELADLAHAAATILVDGANDAQVLAAFQSNARALREAAALELVGSTYRDDVRREAAAALLRTAKAADEPPRYRGEAIEALSATVDFAESHDALVELLDRQWWFFGAQGQHFLIHSLARVIEGLRRSGMESDRRLLESLRPQVAALPSGEREYVEWILDNALGVDRPIFSDRVDPDP
jgi:hypothetical protein